MCSFELNFEDQKISLLFCLLISKWSQLLRWRVFICQVFFFATSIVAWPKWKLLLSILHKVQADLETLLSELKLKLKLSPVCVNYLLHNWFCAAQDVFSCFFDWIVSLSGVFWLAGWSAMGLIELSCFCISNEGVTSDMFYYPVWSENVFLVRLGSSWELARF